MKKLFQQNINGENMTEKIAQKMHNDFLCELDNFTIFLEGGLGVGKTFLIREILRNFKITEEISSPTYTYVQEYVNSRKFAHFDLYRLQDDTDFLSKGLVEIASDNLINKFVEWPQKISEKLKKTFTGKIFIIRMEHGVGASLRKITFFEVN